MPVGERIKRQLKEKEIREEQERLQRIHNINETSRELNQRALKEAEPYLEVLRRAGVYEIFKEIRRTLKLEWKRTGRNCDWPLSVILGDIITPAILETRIYLTNDTNYVLNEEGEIIREPELEDKLKCSHVKKCSVDLRWDYKIESGGGEYTSWTNESSEELTAEVILNEAKQEFFLSVGGITLSPAEWQDRDLVEDSIVKWFV